MSLLRAHLVALVLFGITTAANAQHFAWHPLGHMRSYAATAMTVAPDGSLFMASHCDAATAAALYHSTNGGTDWTLFSTFSADVDVTHILALSNSVIIVAIGPATESYSGVNPFHWGLWRSTDAGQTWTKTHSVDGQSPTFLALYGLSEGVAAMSYDTLYRSSDQGRTWQTSPLPSFALNGKIQQFGRDGLYFFTDTSFYITHDLTTWRAAHTPQNGAVELVSDRRGDLILSSLSGITWRSTNEGTSWDTLYRQSMYDNNQLLILFNNGTILASMAGSLELSNDTGKTWQYIMNAYSSSSPVTTNLDSAGQYYVAWSTAAYRVTDTSQWLIGCTPPNMAVPQFWVGVDGQIAIASYSAPFTKDGGETWAPFIPEAGGHARAEWIGYHPADGFVAEDLYQDAENGVGIHWNMFLHSSGDGFWGQTQHLPAGSGTVHVRGFDSHGSIYAQRRNTWLRTDDLGLTFDQSTTTLDSNKLYTPFIGLPNGSLVLGDSGGIYSSSDRGSTWKFVGSDQFIGSPRTLACDSSGDIMAALPAEGAFLSKDDGLHWQKITQGLASDSVNDVAYSAEGFWLAATAHGVFLLQSKSNAWIAESDGLQDTNILSLGVAGPGRYYVGTSLDGVFTTAAPMSDVHSPAMSVESGIHAEAWPNPSRGAFELTVDIPASGYTDIQLIDERGNEVQQIASGEMTRGEHTIQVANAGLDAGRYFVRVLTQSRALALPVLIVR